jgi:hypothetical protein
MALEAAMMFLAARKRARKFIKGTHDELISGSAWIGIATFKTPEGA